MNYWLLLNINKCSLSKSSDEWVMNKGCLAQGACFDLHHMRLHLYVTQVGSHGVCLCFCLFACFFVLICFFFPSSTQIKPKHIFCLLWCVEFVVFITFPQSFRCTKLNWALNVLKHKSNNHYNNTTTVINQINSEITHVIMKQG